MEQVYLMIDENKNVVALYSDETIASKMKLPIEEKLKVKLTIEKRSINLDLKVIGIFK